jgi:hypothetical protein
MPCKRSFKISQYGTILVHAPGTWVFRTFPLLAPWEEPSICDCGSPMATYRIYDQPPSLLVFSLNTTRVSISKTICIKGSSGKFTVLQLRGIIYSGGFHFTSCIITPGKEVWYHDGMVTKRNCIKKGHLTDFTEDSLKSSVEKNSSGESVEWQAVVVIYSKK